jgi:predicted nucleotidyltransferase/HEPN domain-containing protein
MEQRTHPAEIWRPRRTFASTDPKAVKLTEILHGPREPQLTILFGSRARGDYAEGRSDIDILLIEDHPTDGETAANAGMAFRTAKAELYRGHRIDLDQIVRTADEFRKRCAGVNSVDGHALRDGYILGGEAEYYAGLARRIENRHQTRWANQSMQSLINREDSEDELQGRWAYSAVTHALKAAVNAAGEWCPDLHDVEMLLELARQADPEGDYATTLDPEIYTQYGDSRRGIPPHSPFTGRTEHREYATQDAQTALARAEELKASWPQPRPIQNSRPRPAANG